MWKSVIPMAMVLLASSFVVANDSAGKSSVPAALDFKVQSLEGEELSLADYHGKVVLIVNVASECGATPQYAGLQKLHEKHRDQGLVVLGFPCNQFGSQEPGSALEIREFCTKRYQVTFPMFAKIDVNGEAASPLYKHLTSAESGLDKTGRIGWNFEKFLIGRDGKPVARFGTATKPEALETSIVKELAKPAP